MQSTCRFQESALWFETREQGSMPALVEVQIVSRLGGKKFLSEKQEGGTSVDARGEHAHAVRIRGFEMRGARYGPGAK